MTKLWDSDYGIWTLIHTKWFSIHGTTPRNADVWSLDIDLGKYSLCLSTGPHASIEFWSGDNLHQLRRNKAGCRCYGCTMHQPLSPEIRERLFNSLTELPHNPGHVCETSRCWSECHPPGCNPADCCGDPEVHHER